MQGTAYVRSPAKLNLHLEVRSKREDGFHSLISVFQMIDLFDDISIRSLKEKNVCRIDGMPDIPPEENLIYRSVLAFREVTGFDEGLHIDVKKRIPAGGGLGGGSSNAAATLRVLNLISQAGFDDSKLAEIGADLGSDIPFFCSGACALVTGRGEEVRPIQGRSDLCCLLIIPDFAISTKEAYRLFDERQPEIEALTPETVVNRYSNFNPAEWGFGNSLEKVMTENYPELADIIRKIADEDALYTAMSGSGSACFGIFTRKKRAYNAMKRLKKEYKSCLVRDLLDKRPNPILQ